jgi:hypothetical protein
LALKRLAAELAVGDDSQADVFLKSDDFVDGTIFDVFQSLDRNRSSRSLLLGFE